MQIKVIRINKNIDTSEHFSSLMLSSCFSTAHYKISTEIKKVHKNEASSTGTMKVSHMAFPAQSWFHYLDNPYITKYFRVSSNIQEAVQEKAVPQQCKYYLIINIYMIRRKWEIGRKTKTKILSQTKVNGFKKRASIEALTGKAAACDKEIPLDIDSCPSCSAYDLVAC